MKRKQRRLQLQKTKTHEPPPFVRAAIARHSPDVDRAWKEYENWREGGYLSPQEEERLLRDADELHRRQRQPCDVTSRREADEIYRQFLNFV